MQLIVEDNHSDLKATATAFHKLINIDKVVAFVGPNWAEFTEVAAPIVERNKVPLLSPSGYNETLFAGKQFIFTLWPPHTVATQPLTTLLKRKNIKSIAAVLTENAYIEGTFNPGQTDFRSIMGKIKKAAPDAVLVLLIENPDLGNFLTQRQQLKFSFPLFTTNILTFDDQIRKNPALAEGVVYYDFLIPGEELFLKRYRDRFQRDVNFGSAKAYDAVFILKKAIEDCGLDSIAIRNCLANTRFKGQRGEVAFDRNGVIQSTGNTTCLLQVKNGKFEKLLPK
jgi:ABC-type branched-subunit amino acid transport system substrate-binding protein